MVRIATKRGQGQALRTGIGLTVHVVEAWVGFRLTRILKKRGCGTQEGERLFVAEGDHGVDGGGAAGGDEGRQERGGD